MANIHWNENIRSNLNMNQGKVLEYHDVFPGQEHRDGWASFINSWICPFHVVLKLHLNLCVQTSQHVVQQNWFLRWKFPTHQGPQTQFQAKRALAVKRSSHWFAKIVGSTVMGKKKNNFGSGSEPSMTLLRWAHFSKEMSQMNHQVISLPIGNKKQSHLQVLFATNKLQVNESDQ